MSPRYVAPFMLSLLVSAEALAADGAAGQAPQLASYYASHATFGQYTPTPAGDFVFQASPTHAWGSRGLQPVAHRGLVITGASLFGGTYGLAAMLSIALMDGGYRDGAELLIPVAGPYLYMRQAGLAPASMLGMLWSVAQAAGLTLLIVGLSADGDQVALNDATYVSPLAVDASGAEVQAVDLVVESSVAEVP